MNNEVYDSLLDKIKKCQTIDISKINKDDVLDIKDIKINKRKSSKERMLDFLNDVENPYIFKVNNKLVQIAFSNTDKTAEDCLTNVLKNIYK